MTDSHLYGVAAVEAECNRRGITATISLIKNQVHISGNDIPVGNLYLIYSRARLEYNKKTTKPIVMKPVPQGNIKKFHRKLWFNFYRWKAGKDCNINFESIIGCTRDEFKFYIKSQFNDWMTFENCGEWHHDHIVPLSKAWQSNIKSFDDQKSVLVSLWNYKNIRPLDGSENMKKGGWHKFKKI